MKSTEKRKMEKERQEVRGRKERIQKYRRTFGSSFLIISISFKYLRYALEREVYSYRHVLYPPRNKEGLYKKGKINRMTGRGGAWRVHRLLPLVQRCIAGEDSRGREEEEEAEEEE